jgi:hypothetical protein
MARFVRLSTGFWRGVGDLVLVRVGADAGVEHDLLELRDLVLVLVAARGGERRDDGLDVMFLEGGECFAHGANRISDPDALVGLKEDGVPSPAQALAAGAAFLRFDAS